MLYFVIIPSASFSILLFAAGTASGFERFPHLNYSKFLSIIDAWKEVRIRQKQGELFLFSASPEHSQFLFFFISECIFFGKAVFYHFL